MSNPTSPSLRTLALLGALGPLLFTLAWLAAGLAQDDYDPWREYLSALASQTAQAPWLVMAGMLAAGASLLAVAAAVRRARPDRRAAAWTLALAGVVMLPVALLRQDCSTALAACAAADPSQTAVAHDLLALLVFVLLVAAPLTLRADRRVAAVGLLLLLAVGAEPVPEVAGLVQRVFVTVMLGWTAVTGLHLAGWTPQRASRRIAT